jgi:hypothetical protein
MLSEPLAALAVGKCTTELRASPWSRWVARVVAVNRNIALAEYLTERIRPLVDANYEAEVAKMSREVKGKPGKGKPEVN